MLKHITLKPVIIYCIVTAFILTIPHYSMAGFVNFGTIEGQKTSIFFPDTLPRKPFNGIVIYLHDDLIRRIGIDRSIEVGYDPVRIANEFTQLGYLTIFPLRTLPAIERPDLVIKNGIEYVKNTKAFIDTKLRDYLYNKDIPLDTPIYLVGIGEGGTIALWASNRLNGINHTITYMPDTFLTKRKLSKNYNILSFALIESISTEEKYFTIIEEEKISAKKQKLYQRVRTRALKNNKFINVIFEPFRVKSSFYKATVSWMDELKQRLDKFSSSTTSSIAISTNNNDTGITLDSSVKKHPQGR